MDRVRELLVIVLLGVLAEWLAVPFPYGQLSGGFVLILSTYAILGPAASVWVAGLATLFGQGIGNRGNPLLITFFNAGQYVLAAVVAGWVCQWYISLSPGPYEGILKKTIHRFKYNGERFLAAPLANLMIAQIKTANLLNDPPDLMIAAPLSYDKLLQRGFNQAGLLAEEIRQKISIPFKERVLEKSAGIPSQTGLPRAIREVNLCSAFKVTDKSSLSGKKVLLVDDVFTTGSTVSAITEVVKKAGALRVCVVTATTGRTVSKR